MFRIDVRCLACGRLEGTLEVDRWPTAGPCLFQTAIHLFRWSRLRRGPHSAARPVGATCTRMTFAPFASIRPSPGTMTRPTVAVDRRDGSSPSEKRHSKRTMIDLCQPSDHGSRVERS